MQKWEYTTLTTAAKTGFFTSASLDADQLTQDLNELGQRGWEVVNMIQVARQGVESRDVTVLLKRPLAN